MRNDPKETIETATFEARKKVLELQTLWMEKYPDYVDQTLYDLASQQIDHLLILIRARTRTVIRFIS